VLGDHAASSAATSMSSVSCCPAVEVATSARCQEPADSGIQQTWRRPYHSTVDTQLQANMQGLVQAQAAAG
jgi:hypothetical protein